MVKEKLIQSAKSKVYTDFSTGVAIAWFTGAVVAPFFSQSFNLDNFPSLIIGFIISLTF